MKAFEILPDGVRAGEEWIPYAALIKVASEKNRTDHLLLFNTSGTDRAISVKLPESEYRALRQGCLRENPACYFQTYREGQLVAMAYVLLTATTVLPITGAIACFFRDRKPLGWTLIAIGLVSMLLNVFASRAYRRMRQNNSDNPKKMARARAANDAFLARTAAK